jgi:hypothetical protein
MRNCGWNLGKVEIWRVVGCRSITTTAEICLDFHLFSFPPQIVARCIFTQNLVSISFFYISFDLFSFTFYFLLLSMSTPMNPAVYVPSDDGMSDILHNAGHAYAMYLTDNPSPPKHETLNLASLDVFPHQSHPPTDIFV